MLDNLTDIKRINDIGLIYELTLKAANISDFDLEKEKKMIDRINKQLRSEKSICFAVFENNTPFGYIYGQYFNKKKGFMVIDCFVDKSDNDNNSDAHELIITIFNFLKNSQCRYFRMFPSDEIIKNVAESLRKEDFYVELRHSMEYELSKKDSKPILQENYSFSFDVKDFSLIYDYVETDSFKNSIDSILFPETTEASLQDYDKKIDVELSPFLMRNNEVIGVSSVVKSIDNDLAEISSIALLKSFQGQGLGKLMMEEILYNCYHKNFKKIILTVTANNSIALSLYRKLGFTTNEEFYVITKNL